MGRFTDKSYFVGCSAAHADEAAVGDQGRLRPRSRVCGAASRAPARGRSRPHPFKARGNKLIMYTGWMDPIVPPQDTAAYYESVAKTMGGYDKTKSFFRLFTAPGMGHCTGGPGPNQFDALGALEQWVERGIAPDTLVATHSTNGSIDRSRRCARTRRSRVQGGRQHRRGRQLRVRRRQRCCAEEDGQTARQLAMSPRRSSVTPAATCCCAGHARRAPRRGVADRPRGSFVRQWLARAGRDRAARHDAAG